MTVTQSDRGDGLSARALERLARDAILAGKRVIVAKNGTVVFNAEDAATADPFDLVDLRR